MILGIFRPEMHFSLTDNIEYYVKCYWCTCPCHLFSNDRRKVFWCMGD